MRKVTLDEVDGCSLMTKSKKRSMSRRPVQQYGDEWIDERPSIPDAWVTADLSG